jgi:hypothetical protein
MIAIFILALEDCIRVTFLFNIEKATLRQNYCVKIGTTVCEACGLQRNLNTNSVCCLGQSKSRPVAGFCRCKLTSSQQVFVTFM